MTRRATRMRRGGVLALGFGLAVGLAPGEAPGDPAASRLLRQTQRVLAELTREGRAGPAGLLRGLLAPWSGRSPPPPPGLDPAPRTGAELMEWEAEVSRRLERVDPVERRLLWSMVLEPGWDRGLRARLLRVLDGAADAAGRAPLEEALEGGGAVAWEAAVRLGRAGDPRALPWLLEAAARGRGWGRQYPLIGLALLGDPRGADAARDALRDASGAVRRHAALALGRLGDESDRPRLDDLARRDADPRTRRVVLVVKAELSRRFPPLS